jgi:hypothetical protein
MLLKSILLALLTIVVYWPAMHADFVYDDAHFVIGNEAVLHSDFHWNTARMLTLGSYWLNFHTTGTKPFYFHLTNLILHLFNAFLVFHVARSVFGLDDSVVFFTSGVFLLHPLASEAVIYISGRSELLATAFISVSVLFFARSRYIFACLAAILAMMSKEIALVTPVLWWLVAQKQGRSFWPIGLCLGTGLAFSHPLDYLAVIRQNANFAEFYAILSLLWRSVVPVGLNVDHDFTSQPWIWGLAAAIALMAAILLAFICRRGVAGIAGLWIAALLLPHVLVEPAGYLTEHHFYAPMFGISILIALTIHYFTSMKGKLWPILIR